MRKKRRRGIILILVLVVVAVLAMACLMFAELMLNERQGGRRPPAGRSQTAGVGPVGRRSWPGSSSTATPADQTSGRRPVR